MAEGGERPREREREGEEGRLVRRGWTEEGPKKGKYLIYVSNLLRLLPHPSSIKIFLLSKTRGRRRRRRLQLPVNCTVPCEKGTYALYEEHTQVHIRTYM